MKSDVQSVRAKCFWLITGKAHCWKCRQPTPVSAIVLAGYEEAASENEWEQCQDRTLLRYVTAIDDAALAAIQVVAPWMRYGRSESADEVYLSNHCTACKVLQGDWFLGEAGAVFFPTDRSELQGFKVDHFEQALETDAECSWSEWHLWIQIER